MANGIEVHFANDRDVHGDNAALAVPHDDDASEPVLHDFNRIVKCPSVRPTTHSPPTAVRCRPSCYTVLLTIKLLLCILKLMHKVHAPGETHTQQTHLAGTPPSSCLG